MRTNVHLDEELVHEAMRLSSAKSKREALDAALRFFVERKREDLKRESYRERLRKIQAQTAHLKFDESAVDLIRADRERE